jgi:hypothetical protein
MAIRIVQNSASPPAARFTHRNSGKFAGYSRKHTTAHPKKNQARRPILTAAPS